VTRDAIRFYERSGLLEKPVRTSSQHRLYGTNAVERIRLVRQLQNCGLTIGDIKEILFLQDAGDHVASKRLMEVLRRRLVFLEDRIASMETCRSHLIDMMREVAAARTRGFDVLGTLPAPLAAAPFGFGRRKR
jgi:MerR family Zn(II)-responsive transcriptional regulator of zntA